MEQTCVVVHSSWPQVLGTRFRAAFVYNMGDEEASKDAGQQATAVHTVGRRPKALLVTMDSSLACRTQRVVQGSIK